MGEDKIKVPNLDIKTCEKAIGLMILDYANQEKRKEALSFTAWTHEVGWWHKGSDPNTGWYDPHNTLAPPITLDELYERFKKDITSPQQS